LVSIEFHPRSPDLLFLTGSQPPSRSILASPATSLLHP
jgi:hypothetical protein